MNPLRVRLLAHRGGPRRGPENTLAAVRRAREDGADGLELDVQLSADGEPFLFHDADAARVTGAPGPVAALRWRELRRLRVLGREPIPHLEEALEALEQWPGATLLLDLHQDSRQLAETAAERVARSRAAGRTAILDFYSNRRLLLAAREHCPAIRLAVMPGAPWNIAPAAAGLKPVELCIGWDGTLTRAAFRLAARLYPARAALARAKAAGMSVSGGVACAEGDLRLLLSLGCDGIWTDDIPWARAALARLDQGSL